MIFRARTVVTMLGEPLADGAVAVEGQRIVDVGPFLEVTARTPGEVEDLGDQLLMPGLINAHCHLDYTMARRAIVPPSSFTHWIGRINALKSTFDDNDYRAAIAMGFEELKRWGTTSVLNIESFPQLLDTLPTPPLRTWWFCEFIDIKRPLSSEEIARRMTSFAKERDGWLGGYGISPHAPYTASHGLYKSAAATGLPLTTHIAESKEELLMFAEASGPLYEFLKSIGRSMEDCGKNSPLAHLASLLQEDWIIAHLNELHEDDFSLLARIRPQVAYCPLSHGYFGHTPFPYERLHRLGLNICLATDSLASNQQLNLFAEMRTALKANPWLRPEELVETVTVNPALALKMDGKLGAISTGALADLIAFPFSGSAGDAYEAIVDNKTPVEWMLLNGQKI